jgi:hypothetical protein
MSKETQRSPDRLDWDIRAADALELARLIPPGPERNEALKFGKPASLYRRRAGISVCEAGQAAKVNTAAFVG